MFERDYLMKLIADFVMAVRKAIVQKDGESDPAGSAALLDVAIGNAVDIDGAVFLSLSPESIAMILEVSGTDPLVTEYLARSLKLAGQYHREAGEEDVAALRIAQAQAIAEAYGHEIDFTEGAGEEAFFAEDARGDFEDD